VGIIDITVQCVGRVVNWVLVIVLIIVIIGNEQGGETAEHNKGAATANAHPHIDWPNWVPEVHHHGHVHCGWQWRWVRAKWGINRWAKPQGHHPACS
jgi:hypothetical protein